MEVLINKILQVVFDLEVIDTLALSKMINESHEMIIVAVKSIEPKNILEMKQAFCYVIQLTEAGEKILKEGSPEVLLFNSIPEEGIDQVQLLMKIPQPVDSYNKAISKCWILHDDKTNRITRRVKKVEDVLQNHLKMIQAGNGNELSDTLRNEYQSINLVQKVAQGYFILLKGKNFATTLNAYEEKMENKTTVAPTPLDASSDGEKEE